MQRRNWLAIIPAGSGARWSGPEPYQWTRVLLDGGRVPADWMPEELRQLKPKGPSRGADVTWRIASEVARPGWFMVGDAAAVLDPTSSHGVLKALLSSLTAARLIGGILSGKVSAADAAAVYQNWLSGWFANDAAQMRGFYEALGVKRVWTGTGRRPESWRNSCPSSASSLMILDDGMEICRLMYDCDYQIHPALQCTGVCATHSM